MAKKRNLEEINEELDSDSELVEGYDQVAFMPFKNKETGLYEMWIININSFNKNTNIEVEKTRYDSDARALLDVNKRYTDFFFKKDMKRRR